MMAGWRNKSMEKEYGSKKEYRQKYEGNKEVVGKGTV
jgi:hypothetical protein